MIDPTFILVLVAFGLAMLAQHQVMGNYKKYSRIANGTGMTGAALARKMMDDNGLREIEIKPIKGSLTDNYNPLKKTIYLSEGVYDGYSISAMSIAAHETGHALQYKAGYLPVKIRGSLVPVANFGSTMAFPMFLAGIIFSFPILVDIGIWCFGAALIFHLVTLPVEFNASSRALKYLEEQIIYDERELKGAKAVLNAAAMTYVASAFMALVQFLRLMFLRGSRD